MHYEKYYRIFLNAWFAYTEGKSSNKTWVLSYLPTKKSLCFVANDTSTYGHETSKWYYATDFSSLIFPLFAVKKGATQKSYQAFNFSMHDKHSGTNYNLLHLFFVSYNRFRSTCNLFSLHTNRSFCSCYVIQLPTVIDIWSWNFAKEYIWIIKLILKSRNAVLCQVFTDPVTYYFVRKLDDFMIILSYHP